MTINSNTQHSYTLAYTPARKRLSRGLCALALAPLCISTAFAQDDEDTPFYLTLEPPPAVVYTPQQELDSFRIADGFRVELVVAEPLIEDPVSITWDEDGKMYAVEMRGYMQDTYGNGDDDPIGSVVRLHDDDNDGQMDRREVMLDFLVLPRAISIISEGLLIAEPPNLWLCPSELNQASTIDCDKKVSLGEYANAPGSVEHQENALVMGLDNWIYNAKSSRKFQLNNGSLDVEKTVFRGQWGLGQDDDGFFYYNGNSNLVTGDLYPDSDAIRAKVSPAPGLSQRLHRGDEVFSIRVNPGVNRAYLDNVLRPDGRLRSPTAASGIEIYRGEQFPDEFYGSGFVPESAANLVAQVNIAKDDLTVTTDHITYPDTDWGQRDFMASTDERFRPVETKTGPDGALYVVDMYRGIIQDYIFLSDQLREQILKRGLDRPLGMGRIWRVVNEKADINYSAPNLSEASDSELLDTLSHPNAWWRSTAQRLLVASESNLRSTLVAKLASSNEQEIIHALWTLEGRGELGRAEVIGLIESNNSRLIKHGLRAACEHLTEADLLSQLQNQSQNNGSLSESLEQGLVFCLGRHLSDTGFDYLFDSIPERIQDPYQRVALQSALSGHEVTVLQQSAEQIPGTAPAEDSADSLLVDFLKSLTKQALLRDDAQGEELGIQLYEFLSFIDEFENANWYREELLTGIYEATHTGNFSRISLPNPHPLFATEDDDPLTTAIANARRAFTWDGDTLASDQKPLNADDELRMARGSQLYATNCSACHGSEGSGTTGVAPSLRQSARIISAPEQLIRIVLNGLRGPIEVEGEQWNSIMPGLSHIADFDNDGISGLATFLRRSWGHSGSPISPDTVAQVRQETASRATQWTAAELEPVQVNTHYQQFVGRFGGLQFTYNGRELEVTASIFEGAMEEVREDVFFFAPRGINFEFDRNPGAPSPSVWMQDEDAKRQIMRTEN